MVEHRNMQTRDNLGVSLNKIELFEGKNAIEVIDTLYSKYKEYYPNRSICEIDPNMAVNEKDYLSNFFEYVNSIQFENNFKSELKEKTFTDSEIVNKNRIEDSKNQNLEASMDYSHY